MRPVKRVEEIINDGWFCWAISNHDFKRVASRLHGEAPLKDKALFATALGLCLRGTYCMYEGEELGLPQAELAFEELVDPYDKMLYPDHCGRDGCRTPMPWVENAPHAGFSTISGKTWLPLSPLHIPLAVDAQEKDADSVLHKMRALLAWRKENPAIRRGSIDIIDLPDPLFAFHRTYEGQTITCVYNSDDKPHTIAKYALGPLKNLIDLSYHVTEEEGILNLAPFGYAFFSH